MFFTPTYNINNKVVIILLLSQGDEALKNCYENI